MDNNKAATAEDSGFQDNVETYLQLSQHHVMTEVPGEALGKDSPVIWYKSEMNFSSIFLLFPKEIKMLRSKAKTHTESLETQISTAQTSNLAVINGSRDELKNMESAWDVK